jgi:hydrogenase maturation protein HypF
VGNYNHFEAQLPMAFEAAANSNENGEYLVQIGPDSNGTFIWPVRTVLEGLIDDVVINKSIDIIAARFHNTVSRAMLEFAIAAREKSGIADVALSGGVFCNSYLTNRLIGQLRENKFRVFWNQRVPAGDGCIALGQAAIACEKMKQRS